MMNQLIYLLKYNKKQLMNKLMKHTKNLPWSLKLKNPLKVNGDKNLLHMVGLNNFRKFLKEQLQLHIKEIKETP
jgi:hypothetical protein